MLDSNFADRVSAPDKLSPQAVKSRRPEGVFIPLASRVGPLAGWPGRSKGDGLPSKVNKAEGQVAWQGQGGQPQKQAGLT